MKILMLVNWSVVHTDTIPKGLQAPNYVLQNEHYWFFKHILSENDQIDVMGTECSKFSKFEKKFFRFYVMQAIKGYFKSKKYDIVISHGAQSGVVFALLRRIFGKKKAKHFLIDIGTFNSASEKNGLIEKFLKFSSKSIDGVIYHQSNQIKYYKKYYPWLVDKSYFLRYGAEVEYFKREPILKSKEKYIICVGSGGGRDWDTLVKAFNLIKNKDMKLLFVGKEAEFENPNIKALGFTPIEELIKLIQKSYFSVLPLYNLNFSYSQMTFLQQCILGKAIICAKSYSLQDYGIDGETCLFYECGNFSELADKIDYLCGNEELIKKLENNAAKYVEENINEIKMAQDIFNVISKQY